MTDIFNKKRVKYLENEVDKLWYNLRERQKELIKLQSEYNSLSAELGKTNEYFGALVDYLGVVFEDKMVPDPSLPQVRQPMMRIKRAYKPSSEANVLSKPIDIEE